MTTTNDRHARAIARLILDGHAATEDEAVDLLARLILHAYRATDITVMRASQLEACVALAKKGGVR